MSPHGIYSKRHMVSHGGGHAAYYRQSKLRRKSYAMPSAQASLSWSAVMLKLPADSLRTLFAMVLSSYPPLRTARGSWLDSIEQIRTRAPFETRDGLQERIDHEELDVGQHCKQVTREASIHRADLENADGWRGGRVGGAREALGDRAGHLLVIPMRAEA